MKPAQDSLVRISVESATSGRLGAFAVPAAVVGFALLTALGAQVRFPIPGTDVWMTLQSPVVLLTGLTLAPGAAAAAMFLYLGCGAAGLPVFAPGSAGILGPTGGYLVGFLVAAWLVSVLRGGPEARVGRLLFAGAVGMCVVLAFGALWRVGLAVFTDFSGGSVWLAATSGVVPFVGKAVLEVLLAVTLVGSCRRLGRSVL